MCSWWPVLPVQRWCFLSDLETQSPEVWGSQAPSPCCHQEASTGLPGTRTSRKGDNCTLTPIITQRPFWGKMNLKSIDLTSFTSSPLSSVTTEQNFNECKVDFQFCNLTNCQNKNWAITHRLKQFPQYVRQHLSDFWEDLWDRKEMVSNSFS